MRLRLILAFAGALPLAGCIGLGGGKMPPSLLSLTPDRTAPAGAASSGKMAEALIVLEPQTDRRLAVQRVPVQIDNANLAYLKDAMWVERPARLFRNLLAEALRARGTRLVLDGDADVGEGKLRLAGRLLDMGYDARQGAVVVRYDALRQEPGGKLSTRRFEAVERGVPATAATVGQALNRAANQVAQDVAEWVG